ncbi:DNA-3-methyladenine glycosylase I [Chromatiaceae bacterium AAb-1]|nr:DNA-3-methyladenine glycosylase I [Chromatiaceae bacterium AAb-1]
MTTEINRCPWVDLTKPDYVAYHDTEWGVPEHDDQKLFELLTLEGAQAGLSWYTVLKKRDSYRQAFDQFNPLKVAAYDQQKVEELVQNPGIIRHRGKIEATVNNAKHFLEVQREFGSFATYQWRFVDNQPLINRPVTAKDYPAKTAVSDAFSKDLKKRGFKFVGSTIIYAYMQACGMVNDHSTDCFLCPGKT